MNDYWDPNYGGNPQHRNPANAGNQQYRDPNYPGNQQYRQRPYQEPAPIPAPLSAMAITSLVLGILALLTSFIPIINNASFFLALLGVIFAIVGIVGTVRGNRRGKPLAIAALIVNVLAAVIVLATQSMFSAALDEAANDMSTTTPQTTEEQSATPATDAGAESSSAYAVTIDDCAVTSDYEGKSAIVVTYTFTNNSEDAQSFLSAISAKCFQNGVQLDIAMVSDIDSQSTLSEIKPGASVTVQEAYVLDDQSEVTVECSELISFNDDILAERTFSVA